MFKFCDIEALENFAFHEAIQIDEIADHAGLVVHLPAHRDFQRVVVAVSIRIVAFAVGRQHSPSDIASLCSDATRNGTREMSFHEAENDVSTRAGESEQCIVGAILPLHHASP